MTQVKVIGILGGMGPLATADFYTKLVQATPAKLDSDHPHVIMYADPKVPDRTEFLLFNTQSPLPKLIAGAQWLERGGADLIAMPCNTAHAQLKELQESVTIPFIDMIAAVVNSFVANFPNTKQVGLLATSGTYKINLYQDAFAKAGIDVLLPTNSLQDELVMTAIYKVKSGDCGPHVQQLITRAANSLVERGAGAVVAGCTEIPLILRDGDVAVPVIDPAQELALASLRAAGIQLDS